MAAAAAGYANSGSKCFSAAIRPDSAELDGQTAQRVGRIAVELNAREQLSPQAGRAGYGSTGTFLPGQMVWAAAAGSTGPQLLRRRSSAARSETWPARSTLTCARPANATLPAGGLTL
jgi:hypothetical protein